MISREVVTSVLAQSESKQTDHWCDLSPNVQNSPHSVPGINLTQLRSGHPVFRRCRCLGCNEKHQWDSRCFVNLAALHSSCSIGAPHATKPSLRLKQTWSTSVKTAFIHSQAQFSICKHWKQMRYSLPLNVFRRRRAWWVAVPPPTTSTSSALCYNIERCLREIARDQPVLSLSLSHSPAPPLRVRDWRRAPAPHLYGLGCWLCHRHQVWWALTPSSCTLKNLNSPCI